MSVEDGKKYVYTDWATAPLKYFYFTCVILVISTIIGFIRIVSFGASYSWYSYIYSAATLILSVAAIVGMFTRAQQIKSRL